MVNWLHKAYWSAFVLWHARTEARLPYRPLEEILTMQNRRVQAIIAHAYKTVPYYREVMDKTGLLPGDFRAGEDLARLPILTADQLAREPERFLSRRYMDGRSLRLHSSGTSGRLRKINYNPAALFLALAHGHRQRLVVAHFVGRKFGYREMVSGRPGNIGSQIRQFYESYSWTPKTIEFKRNRLSPGDSFAYNIDRLNEGQPEVLAGYGSYLGVLFRYAWEHSTPIFQPKALRYGGDRMTDADRVLIETKFGVPVLSTYQAAEALRIAFQCERREAFHMSLDQIAIRVVDANGNPVGSGDTGEIVISNLTNRATVLLNYKLGDVVTLSRTPCPCGRTLPTIERIDGRADDLLVLPDGRLIHALVVQAPLHRAPGVIQVQLIQEDLRRFVLRVVCASDTDWQRAQQHLDSTMHATFGNDIALEIERLDTISPEPGGKIKAVISYYRAQAVQTA